MGCSAGPRPSPPPSSGEDEHLARAKINLSLRVTGRRADGYHWLDSVVVFADVGDVLTVRPAEAFALDIVGPYGADLDAGPDNLVTRAVHMLADALGRAPAVALTLAKYLPIASGIGGGSADAAATLRVLADLWDADVDLLELGARLGADVPVCLAGRSCRMTGIGEVLHPLALPPTPAVLVNPGVAVPTAAVFRARTGAFSPPLDIGAGRTMADLVRAGGNDLTAAAAAIAPEIGQVLHTLEQVSGVEAAAMSGSGATCFALTPDPHAVVATLKAARPDWWCVATVLR